MIQSIQIENFKGIKDRVSLDLAPITLLFGPNSAGKSTVIHALHYAYEVLANGNLNADRTTHGGTAVDLGGFRSLVHGHALERRIRIQIELDLAKDVLADYTTGISDRLPGHDGPVGSNLEYAELDDRVMTGWVAIELGWNHGLRGPQLFGYEIGINGSSAPVLRIEAPKGGTAWLSFNINDDVFPRDPEALDRSSLLEYVTDAPVTMAEDGHALLPVYGQASALPAWGRPLRMWVDDDMSSPTAGFLELRRIASKLAVGVGERLIAELERLLYIGPLRVVPPRNYEPALTEDPARWADGIGGWDALHRKGSRFVESVSDWMHRLGAGCGVQMRSVVEVPAERIDLSGLEDFVRNALAVVEQHYPSFAEPPADDDDEFESVPVGVARHHLAGLKRGVELLDGLKERQELVLVDQRSGVALQPNDVGVGISQLLPIVVAALYRGDRGAASFVALEQPELHIHPKLQVELADLFIEQATTGTVADHQFLIETHSEHLLLRLLRRIREAEATSTSSRGVGPGRGADGINAPDENNEGEGDDGRAAFSPAMLNVVYVQRSGDGAVELLPLSIDGRGDIIKPPEGFFGERDEELFG